MEEQGRKSAKTRRETSVQGTNDSSVVSKCSTAACGYFDDQFLHHFVAKQSRRAPLIHRGYYIRAKAFDRIFKKFLAENCGKKVQILSLGCGFDSTYFRLKDAKLLGTTTFFEIDFPDLVRRKHKLIESNEALMGLLDKKKELPLSPHIELSCEDYYLLGVDLTQVNTLEAALKMCGIDFEAPTLLFSECVMTYMTRRCSIDLIKWAAETFEDGTFAMYEQMHPEDAFGLFMQQHFHSVGSPLKSINAFPTVESQKQKFLKNGWTNCEAVDMNTFYYKSLSLEERNEVERLEAFDEYEELNLKYSHYFILVASTQCSDYSYLTSESESTDFISRLLPSNSDVVHFERVPSESCIRRFGHASSLLPGDYVLTTGGFGEVDGRHQRLTDISITDTNTFQSYHIRSASPHIEYSRMHHSSVTLSNGSTYLIAGRQSPYFLCSQMLKLDLRSNNGMLTSDSSSSHPSKHEHCSEKNIEEVKSESTKECDSLCSENENNMHVYLTRKNNGCDVSNIEEQINGSSGIHVWTCPYGVLQVEVVQQTGDIPLDRWRHTATSVIVNGVEKIFLHGGKTKSGEILEDAYLFDPDSMTWTLMSCTGDVPGPRHSHHALFWNNCVVLIGGLDHRQVPQADISILDLTTGVWQRLALSGTLLSRYSHTAQVVGDNLVVIGGVHLSHPPPAIAVVNLKSRTATEYSLPPPDKSNLLMLHRITSVKLRSDRILVFGGGGNCFSFGTHLNRTPVILDMTMVQL